MFFKTCRKEKEHSVLFYWYSEFVLPLVAQTKFNQLDQMLCATQAERNKTKQPAGKFDIVVLMLCGSFLYVLFLITTLVCHCQAISYLRLETTQLMKISQRSFASNK